MDIVTATNRLRDLLEVTEDRYQDGPAAIHINQGVNLLSRTYTVSWEETATDLIFSFPAASDLMKGRIPTANIVSPDLSLNFKYMKRMWFLNAEGNWRKMTEGTFEELIDEFGDQEFPDAGIDTMFWCKHQNDVMIRPIPVDNTQLRIMFQGIPKYIVTGTNGWLTNAEYLCLYQAAVFACIHLTEDQRAIVFRQMAQDEATNVSLVDSMTGTGAPVMAEEY